MCACASWSGVKTRENVSTGSVPVVLAATGQNSSLAVQGRLLHLNHTIPLDPLVPPNSFLSKEALGLNTSNSTSSENGRQSSNESSSLYVNPTTEALSATSSQTVLLQDVTGVTEYSRSLDGRKTLQHNESLTSRVGLSANSISSILSSHENISSNSNYENEEQGVTETAVLTGNQTIETTSHSTTTVDVTTAPNDNNKQESRQTGHHHHHHHESVCDNADGMFSTVII